MTPLEIIAEWRKGCSNTRNRHPAACHECTVAMIRAVESALRFTGREACAADFGCALIPFEKPREIARQAEEAKESV